MTNYVSENINFSHRDSSHAIRYIRDSHIFDFSNILMKEDVRELSRKGLEMRMSIGLMPPHPKSAFIFRNNREILIAGVTQFKRELSVTALFWDNSYYRWENPYYLQFDDAFTPPTGHRLFSIIPEELQTLREKSDSFFVNFVLSGFALLSLKSDTIWRENAQWVHVEGTKSKGHRRPPPSVSIIHLNTHRILHPPIDDDGSGGTVRPHDRKAHRRTRGNRMTWVKEAKIHGGAPEPVPKVAKLQNPISKT